MLKSLGGTEEVFHLHVILLSIKGLDTDKQKGYRTAQDNLSPTTSMPQLCSMIINTNGWTPCPQWTQRT